MFKVETKIVHHLAIQVTSVTHSVAKCLSWPFDSLNSFLRRIAKLTWALGSSSYSLSQNLEAFTAFSKTVLKTAIDQHQSFDRCPKILRAFYSQLEHLLFISQNDSQSFERGCFPLKVIYL